MARITHGFAAVLPNVKEVLFRFPVAALIAFALTLYLLYGAAVKQDVILWSMGMLAMFFTSVGGSLFAERRGWGFVLGVLLSLVASFVMLALFYFGESIALTPPMMPVAAVLAASSVAYLNLPPDNRSYWMFNHTYWFSLLIAGLGGLLIAALVALLIAAYAMLFDAHIDKAYQYSFIISLFFIAPLFWLSILPRSMTEPVEEGEPVEFTSKVTALFVKYVFVPFFFLFAALLHGLAIKVLFEGRLPSGQIGWYGLLLMIGGVGTYLMAYPTRKVSGPLVKFFVSHWMWFLLVPLIMVGAAHYLRVAHYGMTPMRFYLAGLFIWALVLIVYGFYVKYFSKRKDEATTARGEFDLRLISVLAAFIIFISSFGPWGAESVSTNWQKERLVAQLTELGVLKDGVIARAIPFGRDPANGTLAKDTRSTLNYFRDRERADGLIHLLPAEKRRTVEKEVATLGSYDGRRSRVYLALNDALTGKKTGVKEAPRLKTHTVQVREPYTLEVTAKGQFYGPVYHHIPVEKLQEAAFDITPKTHKAPAQGQVRARGLNTNPYQALNFDVEAGDFIARQGEGVIGRFALEKVAEFASRYDRQAKNSKEVSAVIMVPAATGGARLYITSLSYSVDEGKDKEAERIKVMGLKFYLFVPSDR